MNKTIYSDLKVFNYYNFLVNLTKGTNAPIHIRIKPTNRCNHACRYCSYRNPKQSLGKDMVLTDSIPYLVMMNTIKDIIDMGVKAVTFSGGGEPTCYHYLYEVVERLAESNVKFAMLTNGALFSGDIAKLFAKFGSWVRISIDGWDRKSYKNYRKADDFDKVIDNIRNFKSDTCYLGLNIIVTQENAEHLWDIVNLVAGTEIKTIKISPCVVSNYVKDNILYHSTIEKTVDEQIKKIKSSFTIPISFTYHNQLCGFNKDYTWCPNIQIQPVIGADQNIYVCHDKAYELPIGLLASFKGISFKEAWEKADKFKINPSQDCNHHCMAHGKNKTVLEFLNQIHKEFA